MLDIKELVLRLKLEGFSPLYWMVDNNTDARIRVSLITCDEYRFQVFAYSEDLSSCKTIDSAVETIRAELLFGTFTTHPIF